MNKKIIVICISSLFLVAGLLSETVSANNSFQDSVLPESEGVYDVPGHSNLKLKVFVHREKLTKSKPSSTICNLNDPDSGSVVASAGWHLPLGTWTYTLNLSSVPASVGSANLAVMSVDAFSKWSDATGALNKVVFSRNLSDTAINRAVLDGKNIISWGSAPGTALAITYIWYDKITGLATEVDTIMNKKFTWSWSNPLSWTDLSTTCAISNAYDAQDILTHELGHWLGLDDMYDASNYQNATMFGYGSKAEIKKDTLSTGDILGISSIYP